jgi:hypothetical protein
VSLTDIASGPTRPCGRSRRSTRYAAPSPLCPPTKRETASASFEKYGGCGAFFRIEKQQVDIRRVIELARSELSERNDCERCCFSPALVVDLLRHAETIVQFLFGDAYGIFEYRVGEVGYTFRYLRDGQQTPNISEEYPHQLAAAETCEQNIVRDLRIGQ